MISGTTKTSSKTPGGTDANLNAVLKKAFKDLANQLSTSDARKLASLQTTINKLAKSIDASQKVTTKEAAKVSPDAAAIGTHIGKLGSDTKKLYTKLNKLIEIVGNVSGKNPETIKALKEIKDAVKSARTQQRAEVKAVIDPTKLTDSIAKAVERALRKAGGATDAKTLAAILKELKNINTSMKNLPRSSRDPKSREGYKQLSKVADKLKVAVTVDDKEFKKAMAELLKSIGTDVTIKVRLDSLLKKEIADYKKILGTLDDVAKIGVKVDTISAKKSLAEINKMVADNMPVAEIELSLEAAKRKLEEQFPGGIKLKAILDLDTATAATQLDKYFSGYKAAINELKGEIADLGKLLEDALSVKSATINEVIRSTGFKSGETKKLKGEIEAIRSLADELRGATEDTILKQAQGGTAAADKLIKQVKSIKTEDLKGQFEALEQAVGGINASMVALLDTMNQSVISAAKVTAHVPTTSEAARAAIKRPLQETRALHGAQVLAPGKPAAGIKPEAYMHSEVKRELANVAAVKKQISNSLDRLLKDISATVVKQLEKSAWQPVTMPGAPKETPYFTNVGDSLNQTNTKMWTMQIADIRAMRKELSISNRTMTGGSAEDVVGAFKSLQLDKLMSNIANANNANENIEKLANRVAMWMRTASKENITGWTTIGPEIRKSLEELKTSYEGTKSNAELVRGIKDIVGNSEKQLTLLTRQTYGIAEVNKNLSDVDPSREGHPTPYIRSIAIPAARMTPTGTPIIETAHGAERALAKFATFETGMEQLYNKALKAGTLSLGEDYGPRIREIGVNPITRLDKSSVNDIVTRLLTDIATVGGKGTVSEKQERVIKDIDFIKAGYKQAAVSKFAKEKRIDPSFDMAAQLQKVATEINNFQLDPNKDFRVQVKAFVDGMASAQVSAYDMARALDSVKFENIYDIYSKVLTAGPLKGALEQPGYQSGFRKFETATKQVEQMMPLIEPGKPRRGLQQSSVVNLISRTTAGIYGTGREYELKPEQHKTYIKDLNLRFKELYAERDLLTKMAADLPEGGMVTERLSKLPTQGRKLSSLGIPESQASSIAYFKTGRATKDKDDAAYEEGLSHLKALGGTNIKMFADDLSTMAPFGSFQQLGRNISGVTSAMSSSADEIQKLAKKFDIDPIKGLGTETPTLRTERERTLIESGRYGDQGYGFNVIAELRHTAGTFEDQILVSGKLADALTSLTKTLVLPGPAGRKGKGLGAVDISGKGPTAVSDVQAQILKDKDVGKEISKVYSQFQEVLGAPKSYRGRADQAFITEVKKAMSTVRAENVEVQAAKVAEVFMGHFGRKFTTRFGSKGVSMASTDITKMSDVLATWGDKAIKVLTTDQQVNIGLGTAKLPKSMGQLAAEILDVKGVGGQDKLKKDLINSGNKFMIEYFKDATSGLVVPDEAEAQAMIYNKAQEIFASIGLVLDEGVAGINALKATYGDIVKQGGLYEIKPIDIRISALGAGKRGLQTEVLETIMSNIANVQKQTPTDEAYTTLKDDFSTSKYKELLGGDGGFAKYSEALGFKGPDKSFADIKSDLKKTFMFRGKEASEAEKMATRGAELESMSKFYTDVIDEFGKQHKSLVGEKFVQIVEEPGATEAWSTSDVRKGVKGARLNIPAYTAYLNVFGKGSAMMEEINQAPVQGLGGVGDKEQLIQQLSETDKKHWEFIRTLLANTNRDSDLLKELQSKLGKVSIEELKKFDYSTGTMDKATAGDPRSLLGTVMDPEKFNKAFMLQLPTTDPSKISLGEKVTSFEDFYVPSPVGRGIYPEPLIAGEFGPEKTTRNLQDLINRAKEQKAFTEGPEQYFLEKNIDKRKTSGTVLQEAGLKMLQTAIASFTAETKPGKRLGKFGKGNVKELENMWVTFKTAADEEISAKMDETFNKYMVGVVATQKDYASKRYNAILAAVRRAGLLLGGEVRAGKLPKGVTGGDDVLKSIDEFSKLFTSGKGMLEQEMNKKVADVQKSKIRYLESLAESTLGKKGSLAETLFSRKIPAVMAKAVAATVDKTKDFEQFNTKITSVLTDLQSMTPEAREGLGVATGDLAELIKLQQRTQTIKEEHAKKVKRTKELGLPVLGQHEIGVPAEIARKIPVTFTKRYDPEGQATAAKKVEGSLLEMLRYTGGLKGKGVTGADKAAIAKHIEEEVAPYIESLRYPFTGTSSIQPYKAKLLPDLQGKASKVLAVPGAADLPMDALSDVIQGLTKQRDILSATRQAKLAKGGVAGSEELLKLTSLIDKLNSAISDILPKYIAHQQKLDFDGDAIEIHSAINIAARNDIKKHYDTLTKDIVDTASVFRDQFTYEARQPPTSDYTLAEMGESFAKKFGPEKGFEFLKKPFATEDMGFLSTSEQLQALASSLGGLGGALTELRNVSSKETSDKLKAVADSIDNIEGADNLKVNADKIAEAIEMMNDKMKLAVKFQAGALLSGERTKAAIDAQLFKIHTGQETEGFTRLGLAYTKDVSAQASLIGPKDEYKFARDEQARINELTRFSLQKGMDVKHAGEISVSSEITRSLMEIGGGKELFKLIEENANYSDLKDFVKADTQAIVDRVHSMMSKGLTGELQAMATKYDVKAAMTDVDKFTEEMVTKMGFEGFLTRLEQSIVGAAMKTLKAQISQGSGKGMDPGVIEVEAEKMYKEQLKKYGASAVASRLITSEESPLYKFRTGAASTTTQAGAYRGKYGKSSLDVKLGLEKLIPGEFGKGQERQYAERMGKVIATARNIEDELNRLYEVSGSGAYGEYVKSSADRLLKSQKDIQKVTASIKDYQPLDTTSIEDSIKAMTQVATGDLTKISPIHSQVFKGRAKEQDFRKMNDIVDYYTTLAGLPRVESTVLQEIELLGKSELNKLGKAKFADQGLSKEELQTKVDDYVTTFTEKLKALYSLDRALKVFKTTSASGTDILAMLPKQAGRPAQPGKTHFAAAAGTMVPPSLPPSAGGVGPGGPSIPGGGLPSGPFTFTGGALNVHIQSIAEGAGLLVGAGKPYSEGGGTPTRPSTSKATREAIKGYELPETETLSDIDRLFSPRIATGGDVWADIENFITFHAAAKEYQRQVKNIDYSHELDRLEKSSKEVADVIRETATSGPDMDKFRKATERFKQIASEQEGPEGERKAGSQLHKAWKLYRIAEGDYYLSQAKAARKAFEEAQEAADFEGETTGYGEAQSAVARLRKFVGRVAGSRTDIYTEDKKFVMPEMARRLGVYQTPGDLARKATEPLGDDKQLQALFESIVTDLQKDQLMVSPLTKARTAVSAITGSNVRSEMIDMMQDAEMLTRLGSDVMNAWDFDLLAEKVTRLRASLEKYMKYNLTEDFGAAQKKNLEGVIKYLKTVENSYTMINTQMPEEWGVTGDIPVPKWLSPKEQLAMHTRNVRKVREYFERPEAEGGARPGEVRSYPIKILNQTGQVVKNAVVQFAKYGDTISDIAIKERNLAAEMQGSKRGFRGAIERAAKWGAASTVVYGSVAELKQAIGTLAEIEYSLAQLRMVMSPLEADIAGLSKTAVSFAKEYGVAITEVLKSMKVFAQQGLSQAEIIDRTRVSTLASNVTTLQAADATEALTAAMKVFKEEGSGAMRFLDSWSEVEAKHAITAGDMANAIKKSASAAKTAGITFDQLNGIVAAIGSTTRQTGKEVGTSLRFILRRLTADKGPKELAKLGVPVLGDTGELRAGFDVLNDLSKAWKDMGSAQKLAAAQAIGGTRQYNSLIVLMENWDQALIAVKDSTNSKGSAERRNAEVMKTYRKQLEQTKAAMVELQMSFGKLFMPLAKTGLRATKGILEALSAIPGPIKAAGGAFALLLTYMTKGQKIAETFREFIAGGRGFLDIPGTGAQFKKELAKTKYELFGLGGGTQVTTGLKTLGKFKTPEGEEVTRGKKLADFSSSFGKLAYTLQRVGRGFNEIISGAVIGTAAATAAVGRGAQTVGTKVSGTAGISETLIGIRKRHGMTREDFSGIAKDIGVHAVLKQFVSGGLAMGAEVAGMGAFLGGKAVEGFGDSLGGLGDKIKKVIATDDASFVASVAPLLAFTAAMVPAVKALYGQYSRMTRSAQDYAKSMYGVRRQQEGQLSDLRSMANAYDMLQSKIDEVNKSREPGVKARRQSLDTYKAPIIELGKVQEDIVALSNQIAEANSGLALGYDKLGNAVLKANGNLGTYFETLDKIKTKQMATTEVDIAGKFVEDLTKTTGSENVKKTIKDLASEIPVIGELLARGIKIAPAKAIQEVTKQLNALLAIKIKAPLATGADKDIKKYQDALKKLRSEYKATYTDFRNTLSNISTKGLDPNEIAKIFADPKLREGYQVIIDMEPRLNIASLKGKIDWQDVLGQTVLQRSFAEASSLDITKALTKGTLESAGILERQGKVLSNDIVLFMDDVAEKYNIAGNQAIARLKETSDGVFEWVVQYFNTKTLKVEERAFDKELQGLVDSVFPHTAVQNEIEDRIAILNEFVAGAGAGIRAISAQDFKKGFDLGERFFSDINTTTLLQTGKGFTPGTGGFGESPFQKGWKKDFEDYYAKPMEKFRRHMEDLEKLKLEGLDESSVGIAKDLYKELENLTNVLKNNQVVMQYRAVLADLTKTFEVGKRTIEENIAVERSRQELFKGTTGYMKGISEDLDTFDTGGPRYKDLTIQQRTLAGSEEYRQLASALKAAGIRKQGTAENVFAADKALVALTSITEVAKGFGTVLTKEEMREYTETVARTGDTGYAELKIETSKVVDNTAATVSKLEDILMAVGGSAELDAQFAKYISSSSPSEILNALERTAEKRDKAVAAGDTDVAITANKVLDALTQSLASQVGVASALKQIGGQNIFGSKDYTATEASQRMFGGLNFTDLITQMQGVLPEERKWFGLRSAPGQPTFTADVEAIQKLQEANRKEPLISDKALIKTTAATAVATAFQKAGANSIVKKLDEQLQVLRAQLDEELAKPETVQGAKVIEQLRTQEGVLQTKRGGAKSEAALYGAVSTMTASKTAIMEFAKSMGFAEDTIKKLGVGTVATYAAILTFSKLLGTDLSEATKNYGKVLKDVATGVTATGAAPTLKQGIKLKMAEKAFYRDYEANKEKYGFAIGGLVVGTGTGTSDSINARLSNGEYVISEDSTRKVGRTRLDYLNKHGKLPGYADGGYVGADAATTDPKINRTNQLIASAIAATLAGAWAESNEHNTEIATATKKSAAESEKIVKLIRSNPLAAQAIFSELQGGGAAPVAGVQAQETELKSTVLDVDAARKETAESINKMREVYKRQAEELNMQTAEMQERMLKLEMAEELEKELEDMEAAIASIDIAFKVKDVVNKAIKDSITASFTDLLTTPLSFDTAPTVKQPFGLMAGRYNPQEVDFGIRSTREMSVEQFMVHSGDTIESEARSFGESGVNLFKNLGRIFTDLEFFGKDMDFRTLGTLLTSLDSFQGPLRGLDPKKILSTSRFTSAEQTFKNLERSKAQFDAAQARLGELYAERQELTILKEKGDISPKDRARLDNVSILIDEFGNNIEKFNDEIKRAQEDLEPRVIQAGFAKARGERDRSESMENIFKLISAQLNAIANPNAMMNRGLRGFRGDVAYRREDEQLSDQEFAFKAASPALKKAMSDINAVQLVAGNITTQIATRESELAQVRSKMLDIKNKESVQYKEYIREANTLTDEIRQLTTEFDTVSDSIKETAAALQVVTTVSSKLRDFTSALKTLSVDGFTAALPGMQALTREMSSMVGASGPFAKTMVSPKQQLDALMQGGVALADFADSFTIEAANLQQRMYSAKGKELQDIYDEQALLPSKIARTREGEDLAKQYGNLQTTLAPVHEAISALSKAILFGEQSPEQKQEYTDLVKQLDAVLSAQTAYIRSGTTIGAAKTEVAERYGKDSMEYQRFAAQFGDMDEKIQSVMMPPQIVEALKNAMSQVSKDMTTEPVVNELKQIKDILAAQAREAGVGGIEDILGKTSIGGSDASFWQVPGGKLPWQEKTGGAWQIPFFATGGGPITGPGGPREDKVPAMLSPGEFVIRAHAAQQLGYATLNHINSKGSIPGLADGGSVWGKIKDKLNPEDLFKSMAGWVRSDKDPEGEYYSPRKFDKSRALKEIDEAMGYADGGFFTGLSGKIGKGIKALEEYRLDTTDNPLLQGGAAVLELGARLGKGLAVDPLSMLENLSAYQAEYGTKATLGAGADIAKAMVSSIKGLDKEQIKSMGIAAKDALMGDLSKGGLGITTGVLEALIPAGMLTKRMKGFSPLSNKIGAVGADVTPSYLDEAANLMAAKSSPSALAIDPTKYVQAILQDKKLTSSLEEYASYLYGKDTSIAEFMIKAGPNQLKEYTERARAFKPLAPESYKKGILKTILGNEIGAVGRDISPLQKSSAKAIKELEAEYGSADIGSRRMAQIDATKTQSFAVAKQKRAGLSAGARHVEAITEQNKLAIKKTQAEFSRLGLGPEYTKNVIKTLQVRNDRGVFASDDPSDKSTFDYLMNQSNALIAKRKKTQGFADGGVMTLATASTLVNDIERKLLLEGTSPGELEGRPFSTSRMTTAEETMMARMSKRADIPSAITKAFGADETTRDRYLTGKSNLQQNILRMAAKDINTSGESITMRGYPDYKKRGATMEPTTAARGSDYPVADRLRGYLDNSANLGYALRQQKDDKGRIIGPGINSEYLVSSKDALDRFDSLVAEGHTLQNSGALRTLRPVLDEISDRFEHVTTTSQAQYMQEQGTFAGRLPPGLGTTELASFTNAAMALVGGLDRPKELDGLPTRAGFREMVTKTLEEQPYKGTTVDWKALVTAILKEQLKKGMKDDTLSDLWTTPEGYANGGRFMPMLHNGGVTRSTGPHYLEKGEVVLPRRFADGGLVTSDLTTQSLASGNATVTLVWDESKEIKVERPVLEVKDPKLVATLDDSALADNLTSLISSIPDKIELDTANVELDTSNLEQLLQNLVDTKSVGADSEILDTALESIAFVKEDTDGQIELLSNDVEDFKASFTQDVQAEINVRIAEVRKDISDNNSKLIDSYINRQRAEVSKLTFDMTEMDGQVRRLMNLLYTTKA